MLSATHKDLGAEVQAGQFRQDLYYRLNVIQIRVPPLRERLEDLTAISERVLERIARDAGVWPAPRLTPRRAGPPVALSVPGQRARAREPAAPRGRAVGRRGASTSTTSACRSRCSPTARRRSSTSRRPPSASAADGRAAGAAWRRSRSRCRTTWRRYLDEVERDILVRALEHHRFNRTAAGSASACRCGRCATAWRAWASTSAATMPVRTRASGRVERAEPALATAAGWRRARRIESPNFGPRPDRHRGRARGDPFDQPAAGRVRRRRDRAPVHQPARLGRASVLRDDPRPDGVGALPDPPRRRAAAVRVVRRPRLACRRVELARPRRLQRLLDRHRARRARRRALRGRAVPRRSRALLRAPRARATRSPRWPATSTSRRAASTIPGAGFDWAAPAARSTGRRERSASAA